MDWFSDHSHRYLWRSKLRVWHSPLAWLPEGQPAKIAFDITDREIGGTANLQLFDPRRRKRDERSRADPRA